MYVNLQNKFDTVSNGKHLTGYHNLKAKQLKEKETDEIKVVNYDYDQVLNMYLTASDIEQFKKEMVLQLINQVSWLEL